MKKLFISRQTNLFEQIVNPQFTINEDYQIIDQVLSDEKIILELSKDFPNALVGRNRTPIEQSLRFLVLKHQKGLDYRGLERTLTVNLEDRWFCKISKDTPCFKTIQNQLVCINEATIKKINDLVMNEARKRKLTKGRKMRIDSTITEANIHYPTDFSLIKDSVRVITHTLKKLNIIPKGYRSFKRIIKHQSNIMRTLGRKNEEIRKKAINKMIEVGKAVSNQIRDTKNKLIKQQREILTKIVEQAETVLSGINPHDRIVSIFETTARALKKGKAGKICEFGQEVQIQEDEKFITNWEINNKSSDVKFFRKAIDKHKQLYGNPPNDAATDRGYWSCENKDYALQEGVKNVYLPKKGKLNEAETEFQSSAKFKKGQCFRAGGEAKISLLKRKYKLNKCKYKGDRGMSLWVGSGILTCNLMTMVRLTII